MNAQMSCPNPLVDTAAADLADAYRALVRQTCLFLNQLREFDLRRGYGQSDAGAKFAPSTPAWLNRTCGIDQDVTREQLRIAYALLNLPLVEDAFERGELSYRKVGALTFVANATNETTLLDFALVMTDSQVEDYCQQLRKPAIAQGTSPAPD